MVEEFPDSTARRSAEYRAAHQTIEGGRVFRDPLADIFLDAEHKAISDEEMASARRRSIRLFMACRARFAEDVFEDAVSDGVRQIVLLGAGLDTFSLRRAQDAASLRIFEVDRPGLQKWKLNRLRRLAFSVPVNVTFVPVDFECQDFLECLREQGYNPDEPSCFLWLGVSYYLSPEVVHALLARIGAQPKAELVFDYIQPIEFFEGEQQAKVRAFTETSADVGEPWLCFLEPDEVRRGLRAAGFSTVTDLSAADITERYLPGDAHGGTSGCPLNFVHALHG